MPINPNYTLEIIRAIKSNEPNEEIANKINQYHENDIANTLVILPLEERQKLYSILDYERLAEIFSYLDEPEEFIKELTPEEAAAVIEYLDSDDASDILTDLDEDFKDQVVPLLNEDSKKDIALIRSYDDDEIGSKMSNDFVEIRNNLTVKQAMKEVIAQASENENIMTIYVQDENQKFFGALQLQDLIRARDGDSLTDLISTSYPYVRDHESVSDCIERIKEYAEDSLPILNDSNVIIGIITAQDIVQVVDDEMSDDYAKLAGLTSEEDLNETLVDSVKKRMPWLIVLLFLGMGVSSVVGMFETVVSKVAIIVCFQSLILDMAGNVGTQSLAVTIRVLMDENLKTKQKLNLIGKEMRIGFTNGLMLGILSFVFIGGYTMLFKGKSIIYAFAISGCVGVALITSMVISSFIGTIIPMLFHKIKIDPAVASGPLITTINDLVAVITYYGMAWIFLIDVLKLA